MGGAARRDSSAPAAAITTALHDEPGRAAASESRNARLPPTRTPALTGARIRKVYEQTIAGWR